MAYHSDNIHEEQDCLSIALPPPSCQAGKMQPHTALASEVSFSLEEKAVYSFRSSESI